MMRCLTWFLALILFATCANAMELGSIPPDLTVPGVSSGAPAPGKRVKVFDPDYSGTEVYHVLYLPTDWKEGRKYPVIVEYAGNRWETSQGTVEGSSLGYGISAGKGVIWVCLPFVDANKHVNAKTWWGDTQATVEYCKKTVKRICDKYGGDPSNLFFAGFSRGAIACNYIGLHDNDIASLWRGFICHSHYEGSSNWPGITPEGAADRLKRLKGRPQFISHEQSVAQTKQYLAKAAPDGNFTFLALPFSEHSDTWVLRNLPERETLRTWFNNLLASNGQQ